jgi:hypothetical protein
MFCKLIALILLVASIATGQQPFTPLRSLSTGNMYDCGVGPLCVDLAAASQGTVNLTVLGEHLAIFDVYIALSPPIIPIPTIYGFVDLDPSIATLCWTGILNTSPTPHPIFGTNVATMPVSVTSLPVGFNATLQCIMSDSTAPNGFVLTNAIFAFK